MKSFDVMGFFSTNVNWKLTLHIQITIIPEICRRYGFFSKNISWKRKNWPWHESSAFGPVGGFPGLLVVAEAWTRPLCPSLTGTPSCELACAARSPPNPWQRQVALPPSEEGGGFRGARSWAVSQRAPRPVWRRDARVADIAKARGEVQGVSLLG